MQQYPSVETYIRTLFRPVESPESPLLFRRGETSETSQLHGLLLNNTKIPEGLGRFLVAMDKKLDTLLDHLFQESLLTNFPHSGFAIALSGSEVVLECKEPLAPGDFLEIVLYLSDYPLTIVSTLAKVTDKLSRKTITSPQHSAFTLAYYNLEEADKDIIIQHVFQEERRKIRRQKGTA